MSESRSGRKTSAEDRSPLLNPLMLARCLETGIQAAEEAVIVTDTILDLPGPKILWVNRAFEQMTGYSMAEVLGKTPRLLQGPETSRAELDRLKEALRAGADFTGEVVNYRKNGAPFVLQWHIACVKNPSEKPLYYVAIQRDVTEPRREARELIAAKEAERARAEEFERFFQMLAHDLRAPARRLALLSELAAKEPGSSDSRKALASLTRNSGELIQLLESLYQLVATRRLGEAEPVDISEMARSIAQRLRLTNPLRRCEVEVEDGLNARTDPALVRMILQNLLGNAWKFTSGRDVAVIRVRGEQDRNKRWISIADNGVGFDESQRQRLFTPFVRLVTKSEFEGTGLGLSIVAHLVKLLGGEVDASGKKGEGAVFRLTWPDLRCEGREGAS